MSGMMRLQRWMVIGNIAKNPTAQEVVQHLTDLGKVVVPVTPKEKPVKSHEGNFDVANLIINPAVGLQAVHDLASMGVKNIWTQPGACSDEIRQACTEKGLNLHEGCVLVEMNAANAKM
ncbi:hypothetical protein DIPPA_06965 [Diplonema papillatum]|nr:hypothetical protein DIPPA_06965 [Diplonema papillatum]